MNLQYLSDNKGQIIGVFIPIQEWENLKSKYKGLDDEDIDDIRAYDAAKAQDGEVIPFDQAVKDIEEGT